MWALTYIHTYIHIYVCLQLNLKFLFGVGLDIHTYIYIYVYLQLNVKFLFGSPGLAPDVIFAGSLSLNVFSLFCLS